VVGWIVGTVILETVIVALAVVGSTLFPTGEVSRHPREILAYSALHGMPALLGALLMGAIFAKVISTANNYLFSPATNLIEDVFVRYIAPDASNKRVLIVSRLMVVLLGIWALYQALGTESVLQKALYAYTIYSAALTPVILAAFYWRRANAAGAVSAIAAGTFVTVFWDTAFVHQHLPAMVAERDAIFPALLAALICLFGVSLLTKPPRAEQLAQFGD
jgi:SSS family solute:Na+ symporter/sodium/proline symporter